MKRSIFETFILYIACYVGRFFLFSFLLFLAIVSYYLNDAIMFLALCWIFLFLAVVYYLNYSKDRLKDFQNALETKTKKSLAISEDAPCFILTKKGDACNTFFKKMTRRYYDISFIFLDKNFLTIATKCPKFDLLKLERHGRDKRYKVKDSCSENKEYRYSFIQSVHFNSEKKTLDLVLTSGFVEHIPSEKSDADKAIVKIREKLRSTERTIQTNIWRS